ncbi:hypothetical protein B9G55_18785 [Saccharibacillus sp. O16]|nr:hypothetical protein B9G55_18785 [Saccharibacillus sp. O16]
MNRFKEPGESRESARPNWYEALEHEPGRMNKEPTLAQMQKIKEESTMEKTYGTTVNKGKMAKGKLAIASLVTAGAVFGGVWGAQSAGWLDGTPSASPTSVTAQNSASSGQNGMNNGGQAAGVDNDEEKSTQASAEMKASMQAQERVETFKRADLEVTKQQREAYVAALDGGVEELQEWVWNRHGQLAPYTDEKFLASYTTNRVGELPYRIAQKTGAELTVENLKMTTSSVDLEKKQVRVDYTLDLAFSNGQDALPLKGAIWLQEGAEGWTVMKDVPEKASLQTLFKLAMNQAPANGK